MQQRSEETRAKIMEAAIKLFSIRGYNKASVDDICKEAGIAREPFIIISKASRPSSWPSWMSGFSSLTMH